MAQSPSEKVELVVRAGDPGTEIFLINARLRRIASGVGSLKKAVVPGLYKLRFRAGGEQVDRLLDIDGTRPEVVIEGSEIPIASAAPLKDAIGFNPAHAQIVGDLSVARADGGDGELLICLRHQGGLPVEPDRLILRSLDGEPLGYDRESQDASGSISCRLYGLPAGAYRLAIASETGPEADELFPSVATGWQTQVFLTYEPRDLREGMRDRISLRRTSMFMTEAGKRFDPDDTGFRMTELARQGLVQGRANVGDGVTRYVLNHKFLHPIGGLLGAHLLLRQRPRNHSLIDIVVGNLNAILPGQPDAAILAIASGRKVSKRLAEALASPPMIGASWSALNAATRQRAGLVPPGSATERIGHNATLRGAWLAHRRRGETTARETAAASAEEISLAEGERNFRSLLALGREDVMQAIRRAESRDDGFSDLQVGILKVVLSGADRDKWLPTDNSKSEAIAETYVRQFARLPAPAYARAAAAHDLARQFGLT